MLPFMRFEFTILLQKKHDSRVLHRQEGRGRTSRTVCILEDDWGAQILTDGEGDWTGRLISAFIETHTVGFQGSKTRCWSVFYLKPVI